LDKDLKEIITSIWNSSSSILSMILGGKNISVSVKEIETVNLSTLKTEYPGEFLILKISYSGEFKGSSLIFLNKKDAGILFSLIISGEAKEIEKFSEEAIPAIFETFSHVIETWGSSFEKLNLNLKVNLEKVELATLETVDLDTQLIFIKNDFIVDDLLTLNIFQVLPKELAEKFSYKKEKPSVTPFLKKESSEEMKIRPAKFAPLEEKQTTAELGNIDLILDVPLQITVELGRARMSIKEVLELSTGRVIELDKLDGEPLDILANGRLIARGEVVVVGETFGVRVTEILTPEERIGKIRS